MAFRDDQRAQAIQIGAVLLFAVLIIAFSLYQAFIVPNQNQQVEIDHLQAVEGDMQNLRNGIVEVPKTGNGQSVRVSLGTNYPARAVALNPPPPSGQLRTIGTDDAAINITIRNATALDGETADYWNGSERNRSTGWISYEPDYAEFQDPPTLVYDSSTLHSQFADAALWSTGQTLVDGRRITLVALDGSFDRGSSRSASVDIEAISASTTDVIVTGDDSPGNLTVEFTSRRNASAWRSLLSDEGQLDGAGGYVHNVSGTSLGDGDELISIEMEAGATYTLRMAKVGVGTGATEESAAYLTDIDGDGSTIQEGSNRTLVVEARDRFNNPVSGEDLTASAESGTLVNTTVETDEDGRARFVYVSEKDIDGTSSRQDQINVTLADGIGSSFDPGEPKNVSMTVTVQNTDGSGLNDGSGGGGGRFSVSWEDPRTISGNPSDGLTGSDGSYTWNVSESGVSTLQLNATIEPKYEGLRIDLGYNNSSVATLNPENGSTDSNGNFVTELDPKGVGDIGLVCTYGGSSDQINISIEGSVCNFPTPTQPSPSDNNVIYIDEDQNSKVTANGQTVIVADGVTVSGNIAGANDVFLNENSRVEGKIDFSGDVVLSHGAVVTKQLQNGANAYLLPDSSVGGNVNVNNEIHLVNESQIGGNINSGTLIYECQ